jgi:4-amino-4-deoxy-L-arabinose transferase-like glycosyltransferase
VFLVALIALVPTTGDIGLTWDEPSYRYSQVVSEQWWGRLVHARSIDEFQQLFDPTTLLYYWPYGRFGINFHPPLAGQLNLLTYEIFGGFMKDIASRRMSSVLEFALTLVILYQFLSRRYSVWVGSIAAASLLLMPRIYGEAHIAGTDTPGLLLWVATAVSFWKGLYEPNSGRYRVAVGVLLGLAFVEKMGAVMVVGPIAIWLGCDVLSRWRKGKLDRAEIFDLAITTGLMLIPLAFAFIEIQQLNEVFMRMQVESGTPKNKVSVANTMLFEQHPVSRYSGLILAIPAGIWLLRRLLKRWLRSSKLWGAERPGVEICSAMLGFGPLVAWLGNPAWWGETLPRLAHYYALNTDRRGALPDIKILYFGQTYDYSLPWANAWVLIAITVPVGIFLASIVGLILQSLQIRHDRVPLYFFLNLMFLPILRMLPTPAHDGVRLFLPTFFFLAAFTGWGVVGLAHRLAKSEKSRRFAKITLCVLVLAPAGLALARVHPFELSYYNEMIGGAKGAWASGFELSYWYEAFDKEVIDTVNQKLPDGSVIDSLNELTRPPVFSCMQELGQIKPGLLLASPPTDFPIGWIASRDPAKPGIERLDWYMWILTHDSKATPFTRLAFAMTPMYERRPRQLDGLRVVTLLAPKATARAWALRLLTEDVVEPGEKETPQAPAWIRSYLPPLARFWGDGVKKSEPLRLNEPIFNWAERDPESLRSAMKLLVAKPNEDTNVDVQRLRAILTRGNRLDWSGRLNNLLRFEPGVLNDAVEMLITRSKDIRTILLRYPYTDVSAIGGPLDQKLDRTKP